MLVIKKNEEEYGGCELDPNSCGDLDPQITQIDFRIDVICGFVFQLKDTLQPCLSLDLFRTIGESGPSRRTPKRGSLGREARQVVAAS